MTIYEERLSRLEGVYEHLTSKADVAEDLHPIPCSLAAHSDAHFAGCLHRKRSSLGEGIVELLKRACQ